METARRWVLARRPEGVPRPDDFALQPFAIPEPADGQAVIAISHVSVDPGMRPRLTGDTYAPAIAFGETIESAGVGTVIDSRNAKLPAGATVMGGFGWTSHALSDGRGVQVLDPRIFSGRVTPTAAIGIMGIPGLTAYFGLTELGKPKPGETLLVSSAAGAVGATALQIGKLLGLKVIGIAGQAAKRNYVLEILGADGCIDYRSQSDLATAIRREAPEGIDIFFDNVGGEQLDAAIQNMKEGGRIVISGQTAEYNTDQPRGIRFVTPFITRRLRMEGLVVYDYRKRFPDAHARLAAWINEGKLSYREEIVDGFENAPAAFIGLFTGENFGRRLVRVAP